MKSNKKMYFKQQADGAAVSQPETINDVIIL